MKITSKNTDALVLTRYMWSCLHFRFPHFLFVRIIPTFSIPSFSSSLFYYFMFTVMFTV